MALMPCPECKKSISDEAQSCPLCGKPISDDQRAAGKRAMEQGAKTARVGCLWFLGFIGVVFLTCMVGVATTPKSTAQKEPSKPTPVVENSGWDGSVYQVKAVLPNFLKAPDSVKYNGWGEVKKLDTGFFVWVDFSATNGFGGVNRETWKFWLDEAGEVTKVVDADGNILLGE